MRREEVSTRGRAQQQGSKSGAPAKRIVRNETNGGKKHNSQEASRAAPTAFRSHGVATHLQKNGARLPVRFTRRLPLFSLPRLDLFGGR